MADLLKELVTQEEDTLKGKFLIFALDNEEYGIEIKYITEIIGIQPITEMPEAPQYFKGIINLRGNITPVIDVRIKFGKKPLEYTDRTCIIVIDIPNLSVGLIVDNVAEVLSIPEEEIVPPPDVNKGVYNHYIKGIGKVGDDVKLLLDCEKFFADEEVETLAKIS